MTRTEQLGYDIGYTLWKQGYDNSKEYDIAVIRARALQALVRFGIVFASLEERGNFFMAIGKGQAQAKSEELNSHE